MLRVGNGEDISFGLILKVYLFVSGLVSLGSSNRQANCEGISVYDPSVTRPKRKYVQIYAPDHPLANNQGVVKRSRMVLFDQLEGRGAPCFRCGKHLFWGIDLCADHIDSDSTNDDPSNLRPSCRGCNANRDDGTRFHSDPVERGTTRCYSRGCDHPECLEANRTYQREYKRAHTTEESLARDREMKRLRRADPELNARRKQQRKTPEQRAKAAAYSREWRARRKQD